ncbi:hypothetical protein [Rhodopila globiformis]|uniref:Uncharacterized protein n=1 Tax=Rhodopila globiformis TaxID=1071 RepID=A0A2S6NPA8_RHOGL|nr:hypothetical protein [Rhodopila globiformis]PPQ40807.1 hypothetical protein CCS01_00375 [Rhodopila globiformis]
MKPVPAGDDCLGPGRIREDDRKIHPAWLCKVKQPTQSRHDWDLYTPSNVTQAACRPLPDNTGPLVNV